jgi:hypothetical protein
MTPTVDHLPAVPPDDRRARRGRVRLPGPTHPATAQVGAAVLGIAVLTDLLVRSGPATVATGVLVAAIVAILARVGLLRDGRGRWLAIGAAATAAAVAVRTSVWLVSVDLIAAAGLLVAACSMTGGGRLTDVGPDEFAARVGRLPCSAARGVLWTSGPFRRRTSADRRRTALRIAGGLLLAAPLVATLTVLLASADPVFASLLDIEFALDEIHSHVLVTTVAWIVVAMLATEAASPPVIRHAPARRVLGAVEASVVLGCVVALFAVFAGTQAVALAGGAGHILETAGLTRAEYARSGFFQLLAVAALTLAALTTVRSAVRIRGGADDRRIRMLTLAAIALTLVVVVVAIGRLLLYVDVFGLSLLRLHTIVFAGWIGVVCAGSAAVVLGVGAPRRWLLSLAVGTGLAVVAVLNVANPDAVVARHNVALWQRTGRLDVTYLVTHLSDDAVPTLLTLAPELDAPQREQLITGLCARRTRAPEDGVAGLNLARARAVAHLRTVCD